MTKRLFPEQSAANHPGLSDEEILRIIGSNILAHQQHGQDGVIQGKTWQQRFPSYTPWLKRHKLTVDDALAAIQKILDDSEHAFRTGRRVGSLSLGAGFAIEEHMAMPTLDDRLTGRATRQEVAMYDNLKESAKAPEFSPVLTTKSLLELLKLNGIPSKSRQSIARLKRDWQAAAEAGSNGRRFRFRLSVLRDLGVKYPADWD